MIAMNATLNRSRNADLRRAASRPASHRTREASGGTTTDQRETTAPRLTIRRLDVAGDDRRALWQLAGRDSAPAPAGEVLGAELDGRLLAAISLTDGAVVADPFEPTAAARSMLEDRAARTLRARGTALRSETVSWTAQPFASGSLR